MSSEGVTKQTANSIQLEKQDGYRWFIMVLAAVTNAIAVAIPSMGLSMLMPEISKELGLTLVQSGVIWGISSFTMIIGSLFGGSLANRFGPRKLLIWSSLLGGVLIAVRGLSGGFGSLLFTVLLFGFFGPLINLSNFMNTVLWFQPRERGFANGVITLGMAFGFFIGSALSAAVFSPILNGWRNVFYLYGVVTVLVGLLWMVSRPSYHERVLSGSAGASGTNRAGMGQLIKMTSIWLLGLAVLGNSGSIQGILGYLPLYLQGIGISVADAGKLVGSFHIFSMLFVLPISFVAGQYINRNLALVGTAALSTLGLILLSVLGEGAILIGIIVTGMVRDAFMAIMFTSVGELKSVDGHFASLSIGLMMIFMGVGNSFAPAVGNSFAEIGTMRSPLVFWAVLSAFGLVMSVLFYVWENGLKEKFAKYGSETEAQA